MNESGLIAFTTLPTEKRLRARARAELLRLAENHPGATKKEAFEAFSCAWNEGGVEEVTPETRKLVPNVSPATLFRWQSRLRAEGLAGLADNYGTRKGTGAFDADTDLRLAVLAILHERPSYSSAQVWEWLTAAHPDKAAKTSHRSVRRWVGEWKQANAARWMMHTNPDQYKNRYQVAHGSASADIVRLNQRWELDSTPADVLLADGRHSVVGVIDVWSRRARLLVTPTSKATAIGALLRRALLDWGVPEKARTDQGADYTSHYVTDVLRGLEVEHERCIPFKSEQKPHIERFFRTFSHGLLTGLDEYIGHNVAEAQAIRGRRSFAQRIMGVGEVVEIRRTAAELQRFADDWVDLVYHRNPHSEIGTTPLLKAASWTGPVRQITDARALDLLLAELPTGRGGRTVLKKGLRIDNAWFVAPELATVIGRRVMVRYDVAAGDLGTVWVWREEGDFLCQAICPERVGISQVEFQAAAHAKQREAEKELRAEIRALKKAVRRDPVETVLEHRRAEAKNLTVLPPRGVPHESSALASAAAALRAVEERTTTSATPAAMPAPTPIRPPLRAVADPDAEFYERAWAETLALIERGPNRTSAESKRLLQLQSLPYIRARLARQAAG